MIEEQILEEFAAEPIPPALAGDAEIVGIARERITALSRPLGPGAREMVKRLSSLLDEEESDEYGVLRPTVFSFNRTVNLVYHSALELGERFPVGAVCTDDRGGCRIEWTRAERQVRLAIPSEATGRQYVYHQHGKDHSIDEEISAARLTYWLDWLRPTVTDRISS
jgi:hypothetical protein